MAAGSPASIEPMERSVSNVKYEVVGKCFVNGSYMEPVKGKTIIVEAAPGLAGPSLKLVGEAPAPLTLPLTDDGTALVDVTADQSASAATSPATQPGGPKPGKR
jgi:hypothetical protein